RNEAEAMRAINTGHIRLSDEIEFTNEPEPIVKQASTDDVVAQLTEAKLASDEKQYHKKHRILRSLVETYPGDFMIDSREGPIVGVTHKPSGFRLHTKAVSLPPSFLMTTE